VRVQCARLLHNAEGKNDVREAHLTRALGHGRFDAGAKMTDKRRAMESNRMQLGNYTSTFRYTRNRLLLPLNVKDPSGSWKTEDAMSNRTRGTMH